MPRRSGSVGSAFAVALSAAALSTGCSDRHPGSSGSGEGSASSASDGSTGEPAGCGVPAVGDASTCGNGQLDPGELCHEHVTTLPPAFEFVPRFLEVADFNGDGIADVLAYRGVYLGTGDGRFGDAVNWGNGGDFDQTGQDIAVGQVNGDTAADIVIALAFPDYMDPSEDLRQFQVRVGPPPGTVSGKELLLYPLTIGTADFDEDGLGDVVVAARELDIPNHVATLHRNVGDGFEQTGALANLTGGKFCSVADVDGDGHADVVDSDFLLGDGQGGFAAHAMPEGMARCAPSTSFGTDGIAGQPAVFGQDLNCDGFNDVVDKSEGIARSWRGRGAGVFDSGQELGAAVDRVAIGDVNGDGWPDVVLLKMDGAIEAAAGGYEGFAPPVPIMSSTSWLDLAVADLNADGVMAIVGLHAQGVDLLLTAL